MNKQTVEELAKELRREADRTTTSNAGTEAIKLAARVIEAMGRELDGWRRQRVWFGGINGDRLCDDHGLLAATDEVIDLKTREDGRWRPRCSRTRTANFPRPKS